MEGGCWQLSEIGREGWSLAGAGEPYEVTACPMMTQDGGDAVPRRLLPPGTRINREKTQSYSKEVTSTRSLVEKSRQSGEGGILSSVRDEVEQGARRDGFNNKGPS
jgi:hypothetical protein